MTEKILIIAFCLIISILFSLNFNSKWNDKIFEKVRNRNLTWYWFRVFKIKETKENYIRMQKALSIFVISI